MSNSGISCRPIPFSHPIPSNQKCSARLVLIPLSGFLSAKETINRSNSTVRCQTFSRPAVGKSELSD
jgi:hypothetical protein